MIAQKTQKTTQPVDRQLRAYEQANDYLVFENFDTEGAFDVVGRRGQHYVVNGDACSCMDHVRRGVRCKHIHLVALHRMSEDETPAPAAPTVCPAIPPALPARMMAPRPGTEQFANDWGM